MFIRFNIRTHSKAHAPSSLRKTPIKLHNYTISREIFFLKQTSYECFSTDYKKIINDYF
jgi:hypothetical protein